MLSRRLRPLAATLELSALTSSPPSLTVVSCKYVKRRTIRKPICERKSADLECLTLWDGLKTACGFFVSLECATG